MKQRKYFKALLTIFAVLLVLGTLCTVAFAADEYQNCGLAYGQIVPTDSKLSAQKTSYTFYGDSGNLYFMRISSGKPNSWFAVEIYSDAQYKEQIRSFKDQLSETPGNKPLSVTWNFKAISSGTYYGRCYTYTTTDDGRIIDASSLKTFKINIDRLSKRQVPLKSLTATSTGLKITWGEVPTATKYNVYRRAAGDKHWTYITTVGSDVTSYTDTAPQSGKYYAYTVKAGDGKTTSLYNTKGLFTYYLAQPKLKAVEGVYSSGSAKVNWNAVNGAAGYYVYRKGGSLSNYEWKLIATIKNGKTTSYVDYKATSSDWSYTYTVKAFSNKYYSAHNTAGVEYNYIPAPKITKVGAHQNGLEITWESKNPNITKYNVYRKNGTAWKLVGVTEEKSFVDTTVESNKSYTYTVKPIAKTNAGAFNKNGVTAKYIATPKLTSLTFDANYKSIVKWGAVNGASGYKVYRKVNDAKSWTLIATIKNGKTTTYTDAGKKASGAKYTYTVRAFDSKNIHSWFVPAGISDICLAKPLFTVKQLNDEDKTLAVEISWGAINGATKYNVYKRLPGAEEWELCAGDITELSYIDFSVESGVTYEYAVRALNDTGSISMNYVKTGAAVQVPQGVDVTTGEEGVNVIWNEVPEATQYNIYRAEAGTENWIALDSAAEATFVDTSDEAKTTSFIYSVTAVVNGIESIKSAAASNTTEISVSAELDKEQKAIVLTWDSPLADTVIITKITENEEAVEVGAFSTTIYNSYADTSVEEGKEYTYTFIAQTSNKVDGTATITVAYPYPPLEAAMFSNYSCDYNNGDPIATICWYPVEFASEYEILRSENGGDFTTIATVKAEELAGDYFEYVDSVSAEIPYTYRIRAISEERRDPSTTDATEELIAYKPLDGVSDLKAKIEGAVGVGAPINVKITWAHTENAESYIIECTSGDEIIARTTLYAPTTECVFEELSVDTEYSFRVIAYSQTRGSASNTIDFICNSDEF